MKNGEAEPVWYGRSYQLMHEHPKPCCSLSAALIGLGLLVAAAPFSLASCSSEKSETSEISEEPEKTTLDHGTAYQAERETQWVVLMSGCKMLGQCTVTGSTEPPQDHAWTIAGLAKLGDDQWRLDAEIEHGGKSVTATLEVAVRWEGDTPVIEATDVEIPELGSFTARIEVADDRYTGTWSGGDRAGQITGQIVRDSWSSWRGPDGTGASHSANPPIEWSEQKNIRWKVPIPGLAASSPIVWKDRIFLTTAIETDVDGAKPSGRRPTKVHEFAVMALDRSDGSTVWRTTVVETVPHEAVHATATQVSSSPVTDGSLIYAHFGSRGLYCLDMDGEVQWSRDFGRMRTRAHYGEGSSPALYGTVLAVKWDHEGDSFVTALDKQTGEEFWRRDRDDATSWSSPLIVPVNGSSQIVTTAHRGSRAYDLVTGEEVWRCTGMVLNCIPTPVYRDGVTYLMSGFRKHRLQAIRLAGAKGDITGTDRVLWSHSQGTSYAPSPLLYDDNLYFLRLNTGVLSCLDANTGEVRYEGERLRGIRTMYSSPVGAAGRGYFTGRGGMTKVVKLGPKFELLATNQLDDDGFDASAALVGDELYLRGRNHLYCIAESKPR